MKKLILIVPFMLSACVQETWFGEGTQVGYHNGTPLMQSTCEVDPNVVGQKKTFKADEKVTSYYSCEGQMKVTCPTGYQVVDLQKGTMRRASETIVNGGFRHTRTFTLQKTTVQYTCNG